MAIPYFEERMRDLKPGITGLAQVTLGYQESRCRAAKSSASSKT